MPILLMLLDMETDYISCDLYAIFAAYHYTS